MKNSFFTIISGLFFMLTTFSAFSQIHVVTGVDLRADLSSGWFNQIRFYDGYSGGMRHVIADHGTRDRLIIYPGIGGGANAEVEITGKVAIATTNIPASVGGRNTSGYNLFVKGGILTEEVLVRTNWADYVFKEDYQLMPLNMLRSYIDTEGHLPNMPSEEEVETNGLELSSVTVLQQEKIEEAFLYILQLEKKVKALEQKLELLGDQLEEDLNREEEEEESQGK